MGKNPAFQFYVRDWLSDPQLKMASFSTKGMWIYFLCFMWEAPERGKLVGTREQLYGLIGAKKEDMEMFVQDATRLQFCCYAECDGIVTLINRRMNNEWKEKELAKLRMQRKRSGDECYGNVTPDVTGNVTPISSTSSSSSTSNNKTLYLDCIFLTAEEHQKLIAKHGQFFTDKAISILNNYLMSKGKDPYKSHYHTLIGWPMERAKEKYEKKQDTSSPYDTCKRCGAEYRKGDTVEIKGMVCCPKCVDVREQERNGYLELIGKIGRPMK